MTLNPGLSIISELPFTHLWSSMERGLGVNGDSFRLCSQVKTQKNYTLSLIFYSNITFNFDIKKNFFITEPGRIQYFGYQGTPTSVTVYWSPPVKPNGVIRYYNVKYYPLPQTDRQGNISELAASYMSPVLYPIVYNACVVLGELNVHTYSLLVNSVMIAITRNSGAEKKNADLIFNITVQYMYSRNDTDEEDFNKTVEILNSFSSLLDLGAIQWMSAWNVPILELCNGLLWVRDSKCPVPC